MLYDYILKNYEKDEPIFLSELPGDSRDYVRQEMKKLVDTEKYKDIFVLFDPYLIAEGNAAKRYLEEKGGAAK